MELDGKQLAGQLLEQLKQRVLQLKKQGLVPHLAVVLIGDNPDSLAYIKQKQKATDRIGARFTLFHLRQNTSQKKVVEIVKKIASDTRIHGLIVQRPTLAHLDAYVLSQFVPLKKDVDGFKPLSPFFPPVALAVLKLFNKIYHIDNMHSLSDKFLSWLSEKQIVILGKGETAGKPIAQLLTKKAVPFSVLTSKSANYQQTVKKADIIISCVGKAQVVTPDMIKRGVILIGVGLHLENGKLRGDYNDEDMSSNVAFYTPTPGGVGPLNVASLMENLLQAANLQS